MAEKKGRIINDFSIQRKTDRPGEVREALSPAFGIAAPSAAATAIFTRSHASGIQHPEAPHLPGFKGATPAMLDELYESYAPGKYSLADQGYIVTVHPLELWLARYLISHPLAQHKDVIEASKDERISVYHWLFKTVNKNSQDIRIRWASVSLRPFGDHRHGTKNHSIQGAITPTAGEFGEHQCACELCALSSNGVRSFLFLNVALRRHAFEDIVERRSSGERFFSRTASAVSRY